MAIESVWKLRDYVNENAVVAADLKQELGKGASADLPAFAARHGFEVTADELERGWAEIQNGDLSDVELELVAGGAPEGDSKKTTVGTP